LPLNSVVIMTEEFDKHILKNGMVLLCEPMAAVESAAFDFMLPAGAAVMPQGCCGAANVISDWIFRGAAGKDSRQLSDALEGLGLHRAASVGSSHITIGAAMEAGKLSEALKLYADVILRSRLEDEQFEPARQLVIDGVHATNDEPRQNVMVKLRKQFYPSPIGRSTIGNIDELKKLTPEKVKKIVENNFDLSNMILSVAGKYDFDEIVNLMEQLFDYESGPAKGSVELGQKGKEYTHLPNEGAQVHIGLMSPTVKPADEQYYNARMAVSVLSGGMSGRLFTEVREKRGLCYAVGARYHGLKDMAGIMCYAGSVPDSAQQTLDVIIEQFKKLSAGITKEEIERAKVGLKSALILQSESSSSRAGAIGMDYYMLGRVRSLEEIKENIEKTTRDSILQFLRDNKFEDFTVVTIGPKELSVKQDIGP